jgi:glycosyltransferase involved in cell wall biosynthesis
LDFVIKSQNISKNNFISVGRLIAQKQPGVILGAYLNSSHDGHLRFVGSGILMSSLKAKSKKNDSVFFVNKVDRRDVLRFLGQSNFFVSASTVEGLPIALLEALERGCVPIVSDIEPHKQIFNAGIKGYLFNSQEELIEILQKAISLSLDERLQLVKDNRKVVELNFSNKMMNRRYLSIYFSLFITSAPSG